MPVSIQLSAVSNKLTKVKTVVEREAGRGFRGAVFPRNPLRPVRQLQLRCWIGKRYPSISHCHQTAFSL